MSDSPKRRRFRFSLRTLVIVMLLAASVTGLLSRWEPWYRSASLPMAPWSFVAFSPDGRRVGISAEHGAGPISVWDIASGRLVSEFRKDKTIYNFKFSPDGAQLFAADVNDRENVHMIEIWDVGAGTLLRKLNLKGLPLDEFGRSSVHMLNLAPDNRFLFVSGPVKVWDAETGALKMELSRPKGIRIYSRTGPSTAALEPEESNARKRIESSNNVSDLGEYAKIVGADRNSIGDNLLLEIYSSVSPNGCLVLTSVTGSAKVQLWNTASRQKTCDISLPETPPIVEEAVFSPDSKLVAIRSESFPTYIFSTETGHLVSQLPVDDLIESFSNDNKRLIVRLRIKGTDCGFEIIDTLTGGLVFRIGEPSTFSADGMRAVTVNKSREAFVTNLLDDDIVFLERISHANPVWLSPRGDKLVLHDSPETLSIWHRRRPERWWGIFWLPEFWLTVLFTCALAWSFRRDLRAA